MSRHPRGSARSAARSVSVATAAAVVVLAALTACSGGDDAAPASSASAASPGASVTATSGASSGAPAPSAPPAPSLNYPVVVEPQALRIGEAVEDAVAAAVQARDVAAAQGRVTGPAAEVLAAQLTIARVRTVPPPPAKTLVPARLLVPRAAGWPRWFVAAGSVGKGAPAIRVLLSPSAREPYAVWAELTMLPGATLPEAANTPSGVATLAPTGPGLNMTPAEVASRYADLLNRGRASDYRTAFADDDFRTQLNARLAADRKQIVATAVATLTSTHSAVKGTGYTLRTVDGGALVIVELRQAYQVRVEPGRGAVKADPDLAALAGKEVFSARLDRAAVEVLAFWVPSKGSSKPVRLIAASKGDVSATGE